MNAPTLFDLAAVAPTRGERRAHVAEQRRVDRCRRALDWRYKQGRKQDAKAERARQFPGITCCLYWYAPGSGWTHCHKCKRPLYHRNEEET